MTQDLGRPPVTPTRRRDVPISPKGMGTHLCAMVLGAKRRVDRMRRQRTRPWMPINQDWEKACRGHSQWPAQTTSRVLPPTSVPAPAHPRPPVRRRQHGRGGHTSTLTAGYLKPLAAPPQRHKGRLPTLAVPARWRSSPMPRYPPHNPVDRPISERSSSFPARAPGPPLHRLGSALHARGR